jgi:hypothetical protein
VSLTRNLTATGNITTNSAGPGNAVGVTGAHNYDAAAAQVTK